MSGCPPAPRPPSPSCARPSGGSRGRRARWGRGAWGSGSARSWITWRPTASTRSWGRVAKACGWRRATHPSASSACWNSGKSCFPSGIRARPHGTRGRRWTWILRTRAPGPIWGCGRPRRGTSWAGSRTASGPWRSPRAFPRPTGTGPASPRGWGTSVPPEPTGEAAGGAPGLRGRNECCWILLANPLNPTRVGSCPGLAEIRWASWRILRQGRQQRPGRADLRDMSPLAMSEADRASPASEVRPCPEDWARLRWPGASASRRDGTCTGWRSSWPGVGAAGQGGAHELRLAGRMMFDRRGPCLNGNRGGGGPPA